MSAAKPLGPITFVRARHNDLWCRVCGGSRELTMSMSCGAFVLVAK